VGVPDHEGSRHAGASHLRLSRHGARAIGVQIEQRELAERVAWTIRRDPDDRPYPVITGRADARAAEAGDRCVTPAAGIA
jgi:hypothetical protein